MNGERLRFYREKKGFTQLRLASSLKVDRSTVAKWESEEASPRASMIPQIAKLLKCKIQDLF